MIRGFASDNGRLTATELAPELLQSLVWIDLINPTSDETESLEKLLGIAIPSREEMEEIEISSRLYQENGVAFMTAIIPANADGDDPQIAPVTFILAGGRLVTVRFHEPRAFRTFLNRAEKTPTGCETSEGVLIALLEAIVDRLADILERAGRDIDSISRTIFQRGDSAPTRNRDFQQILEEIGRKGDLTSNVRDSLVTLERLSGYLGPVTTQRKTSKEIREQVKTLYRDVRSLSDHAGFMSQKTTFLLDATLGMVGIEQNAIIKIFSVAAVIFLPPTLIASMYGMNFVHIPELKWALGYPFAIGLMILSAILPYLFFKRRGWL